MSERNLERNKQLQLGSDVKTASTDSILASIYQNILAVCLQHSWPRFNRLMEDFLSDVRNNIPQNIKEKSSARGNLRKELLRPVMTWKVFCKGLRFLKIKRFTIIVQLHHANGITTEHKKEVQLADIDVNADVVGPTKMPD